MHPPTNTLKGGKTLAVPELCLISRKMKTNHKNIKKNIIEKKTSVQPQKLNRHQENGFLQIQHHKSQKTLQEEERARKFSSKTGSAGWAGNTPPGGWAAAGGVAKIRAGCSSRPAVDEVMLWSIRGWQRAVRGVRGSHLAHGVQARQDHALEHVRHELVLSSGPLHPLGHLPAAAQADRQMVSPPNGRFLSRDNRCSEQTSRHRFPG